MFGGTYTRNLATANFAGMVQWIIDFMTDTDPNSWSIGDGDQRGYGFNYLEYEAADSAIPFTPTISYVGEAGYPLDQLQFSTSAFSDPNGGAHSARWNGGSQRFPIPTRPILIRTRHGSMKSMRSGKAAS